MCQKCQPIEYKKTWYNKVMLQIPCHRLGSRSLSFKGAKMPLCSRCLAMYATYILLPLFFFVPHSIYLLYIGFLLLLPLIIDGYTQKWKWRTSNHILRIVTGFLFTSGCNLMIVFFVKSLNFLV